MPQANKNLLKKMFLVELAGENFYRNLAKREKREVLKEIYRRLEVNECETKMLIERELRVADQYELALPHKTAAGLVGFFCRALPISLLNLILKSILNRKMYSTLSEQYRGSSPELWNALVKHEQLQRELLTPYWNQKKGGGLYG